MNDTAEALNATVTNKLLANLYGFSTAMADDPLGTLYNSPVFVIITILILVMPFVLKTLFPESIKKHRLLPFDLMTPEEYQESVAKAKKTSNIWEIGVSGKSASVVENGVLRAIAFTEDFSKPKPSHVVCTVLKAIIEPIENECAVQKPEIVVFLPSVILTQTEIDTITKSLSKYQIKATTSEKLEKEMPELAQKKKEAVKPVEVVTPSQSSGPQQVLPFNEPPKRGCFSCHKEIPGKASQCSACKAVIYCSADCAKKNWTQHKQTCAEFKTSVEHVKDWDLHDFPFDFYNRSKILHNYNCVPFLTSHALHNVGLFQRLCGCYQEVPWGALAAQTLAHFQQNRPSPEDMFAVLGLPQEMFPLSKPFPEGTDVSAIDSWESYYQARGYPLDNPAALVLEVPLTVWYLVNQFHMKDLPPLAEGERRRITLHLVGAEKEADLLPLFECILPFFPKTDIAIHMIGNNLSNDIPPQQRAMAIKSVANDSSIFITITTGLYQPQHLDASAFKLPDEIPDEVRASHNFGDGKPDLIICMNASLVVHGEWAQATSMIAQAGAKMLVTERMEQLCNSAAANLPRLNASIAVPCHVNPFRQPLYDFKKDVNLPGWSNGFIFGIGSF